jgi:methylenetetrahydrofolate reductase (NADPH)
MEIGNRCGEGQIMSRFRHLLENTNEKVFTAEFPHVDGGGMSRVVKQVERLAPWFDAVNATDNTAAHAHASNVSVAIAMKMHGLEPIMQIVCRDKNRLAIQADMVGADLHGIENLSLITGQYLSGRKISPSPNFYIGAVENAAAPPIEYRVERALKKSRAGARFLQLQICFHPDRLEKFCTGVAAAVPSLHLLPTIVLVKGGRQLHFINDKVPGIDIPNEIIDRVERSANQLEAAFQLALEQARHCLAQPAVRGLHIADFRHDDSLARFMSDLGRTPQLRNQL